MLSATARIRSSHRGTFTDIGGTLQLHSTQAGVIGAGAQPDCNSNGGEAV
jgi:hypothetical protein